MQLHSARLLVLCAVVISAACSGRVQPPAGGVGAAAPELAVERFLQLALDREYLQMGWFFGTTEGSVLQRDSPEDVERRMYALATVLQNQGFIVGPGAPVPGRVGAAQVFNVQLTRSGEQVRVPITVVRAGEGRWLVEDVPVQAITNQ